MQSYIVVNIIGILIMVLILIGIIKTKDNDVKAQLRLYFLSLLFIGGCYDALVILAFVLKVLEGGI